ncbi:MAG: nucleotide exchange factor GrpE [Treponema sp.]|jgi:molecular chaperone GrpE|nr:nucleotide exchange factor GrpE [Treponema sp.]
MPKHASHRTRQEGENLRPDADPGIPGGEAFPRQEDPSAEAAFNGAAEGRDADPGKGPEAAQGADAPPERKIAELEALLAKSDTELAESKDQYLRKAADFENFRKRMNREKQDAIDFANQSLLLDLIPILDDFDRALETAKITAERAGGNAADPPAAAPSLDLKSFYEGFEMIARRLSATLETRWGLKSYVSAGEPFDPNRHEALMVEKSAEAAEQIVRQDLLKGYTLKDRVIRSAKVKVLVPDPSVAPVSGSAGESGAEDKAPRADFDSQN